MLNKRISMNAHIMLLIVITIGLAGLLESAVAYAPAVVEYAGL